MIEPTEVQRKYPKIQLKKLDRSEGQGDTVIVGPARVLLPGGDQHVNCAASGLKDRPQEGLTPHRRPPTCVTRGSQDTSGHRLATTPGGPWLPDGPWSVEAFARPEKVRHERSLVRSGQSRPAGQ